MARKVKIRSILIGIFFSLMFLGIIFRLYVLQVIESPNLLSQAERMWKVSGVIDAKRGLIVDRNNHILAEDTTSYTVAVLPQRIHDLHNEQLIVSKLAPILKMSKGKLLSIVTSRKSNGKYYEQREVRNEGWKINNDKAQLVVGAMKEIQDQIHLNHIGIRLIPEKKRYYPDNSLAAHVLGYTNKEGQAIMGLEYYYNDFLSGKPGSISFQKDRYGVELPDSKAVYHSAIDGKTLRLTLDDHIQLFIENAMQKAYDQYHPVSMTAIAVDPKTMGILGMVSLPSFNPNRYWETTNQSTFKNNNIASQYEPGSTFKIVTLAATVQEGLFHPEEKYQSGHIDVPGRTLHDWNPYGWGKIPFIEGLIRSSNVAFVELGYYRLGEKNFLNYVKKFGFGRKTGIDLPSEVTGEVSMRYPSEFATATYGQGKITVTPIQLTAAYAAVANGGNLLEPHIVKDIVDPKTNKVIKHIEPKVIKRVVSEQSAKQVALDLEQVVANQKIGTGRHAYIPGYRIAGKTGTASIVPKGATEYSKDTWLFSFVGFAPVDDPKILISVMIDEPQVNGNSTTGGLISQEVFKDIASQSLVYLGVPKNTTINNKIIEPAFHEVNIPNVTGLGIQEAQNMLSPLHVKTVILGSGTKVLKQFPAAHTKTAPNERIYLLTQKGNQFTFPNLTGLSLRNTMEICTFIGARCQVTGDGYVKSQHVSGEGNDRIIHLTLESMGEQNQKN